MSPAAPGPKGRSGEAKRTLRVQGTLRSHLWWWEGGGGRVDVDVTYTGGKPASGHGPGAKTLVGGPDYRFAYAAQPSYPAKEEVTVVVTAANSAARKRSRASGSVSRDRDSRASERGSDGLPDGLTGQQAQPAAASGNG